MNLKWIGPLLPAVLLVTGAAPRASADTKIDVGTQCPNIPIGIHCCPDRYAMAGLQVDRNYLLCSTQIDGWDGNPDDDHYETIQFSGDRYLDYYNQCWSDYLGHYYHCCPNGDVMVGIHVGQNILVCQPTLQSVFEVPGGTGTQAYGMHACTPGRLPNQWLMSGVYLDSDEHFFCNWYYE